MYFKNWKCYPYRFTDKKHDYTYQELKEFFFIDGSEVLYCKKSFGICEPGNYYLVSPAPGLYGNCFGVVDWHPFKAWVDKEYMKDGDAEAVDLS